MKGLVLNTTDSEITVILTDGDKYYAVTECSKDKRHTQNLLSTVDSLLNTHNIALRDIDCYASIVGPGSFTGIRVGVSTVNAFAYACNKPLVEINMLEVMAEGGEDGLYLIDALHGNCYGLLKDGDVKTTAFYEKAEIEASPLKKHYKTAGCDYAENIVAIFRKRVEEKRFVSYLMPLYLRESQAEREAAR